MTLHAAPRAESTSDPRARAASLPDRHARLVRIDLPILLREQLVGRLDNAIHQLNERQLQSIADDVALARSALAPVPETRGDAAEHFAMYATYAKTLRTWLSAYGVAALAALLASRPALEVLQQRGDLGFVLTLLLIGLAMQVVLAGINKYVMWQLYYGEDTPEHQTTWSFRMAQTIVPKIWIDIALDLVTVACYLVTGAIVGTAIAGSGVTNLLPR